ncbi:MAG: hypothetical protein LZF60_340161 [Nitrospira sp.]|nr:MAG: hypothetical protein LZF60_340161 [Nitrospira sp.]
MNWHKLHLPPLVVLVAGLTHIIMGLVPGWLVVMRVIYTRYNQQPARENHADYYLYTAL